MTIENAFASVILHRNVDIRCFVSRADRHRTSWSPRKTSAFAICSAPCCGASPCSAISMAKARSKPILPDSRPPPKASRSSQRIYAGKTEPAIPRARKPPCKWVESLAVFNLTKPNLNLSGLIYGSVNGFMPGKARPWVRVATQSKRQACQPSQPDQPIPRLPNEFPIRILFAVTGLSQGRRARAAIRPRVSGSLSKDSRRNGR